MSKLKILAVFGMLAASFGSFAATAHAATASNSQSGAGTSNPYDTAASAFAKQQAR